MLRCFLGIFYSFFVKRMKSKDSRIIDSQTRLCELLRNSGIPCATTYKNNEGKLWSIDEVSHNGTMTLSF